MESERADYKRQTGNKKQDKDHEGESHKWIPGPVAQQTTPAPSFLTCVTACDSVSIELWCVKNVYIY